MPKTTITRASGQHHGNLRVELEQAALALVAERGAHGFTMAEASRRAGVSVAAPFKHFSNREALLAALAVQGYAEQERRYAAAIAGSDDPVEQLALFAAAYVRFAVEQPAFFEVMFAGGLDKSTYPELEEAGRRVLAVLATPAQALRPEPEAALELIYAIAASAHGYATFLAEGVFGPVAPDVVAATEARASSAARLHGDARERMLRGRTRVGTARKSKA